VSRAIVYFFLFFPLIPRSLTLFFLSSRCRTDVNQLFDVALGMYDFQLVLMIAQYSQKVRFPSLPLSRLHRLPTHTFRSFFASLRTLESISPSSRSSELSTSTTNGSRSTIISSDTSPVSTTFILLVRFCSSSFFTASFEARADLGFDSDHLQGPKGSKNRSLTSRSTICIERRFRSGRTNLNLWL